MPERSPFDYIQQRKEDGYNQDFWLSDSESGRAEIARREVAAARSGDVSRKEIDSLARYLGKRFAEERRELRLDIKEQLADARTELSGLLASAMKVQHEIDKLKAELAEVRKTMPTPRVVSSKSA